MSWIAVRDSLKRLFPHERRVAILARILGFLVPLLYRTWRVTIEHQEKMDAAIRDHNGAILVTWHGRTLVPIACFRNRGYYALISRSQDGDMMSAVFERLGWRLIRGSTGRRAVEALRTGKKVLAEPGTILAFTPDGPRGPARVANPGMIYFAQKTGKPIVPAGISARSRHLFSSWDRFQVPLPFSHCLFLCGDPITIGPDDDPEEATRRVQAAINMLEEEADRRCGHVPSPASWSPPSPGETKTGNTGHPQGA